MINLSVVIPAYNEADNLKLVLPKVIHVLNGLKHSFEILIIDTETPLDDTMDVCESYASNHVRYILRSQGPSFGSAVRTGINQSKGKYVVCMDADGSHDAELIETLYSHRNDADVVVASRYVKGGGTENSWALKQMSLIVNIVFRLVFAINCKDISNSYKLYDGQQLRALDLRCENFDLVEEILVRLKRAKPTLQILEIPCFFRQRKHGYTKRKLLLFVVTFLYTLVRLRFMK